MKASTHPGSSSGARLLFVIVLYVVLAVLAPWATAADQTQSLTLEAGWNSVWLEVSPTVTSGAEAGRAALVEDVFTDPAITIISRPILPVGTAEFISDPQVSFNQEGWVVWHRDSPSGNTLTRIRGNQAYLIFNGGSSDITLQITGAVRFFQPTWRAASYNLVGFGLGGNPTFVDVFGAAGVPGGIHPISKHFALDPASGHWRGVQPTEVMRPGVAYWVYSERNSTFAGLVKPQFDGIGSLDFGAGPGDLMLQDSTGADIALTIRELTLTNTDASGHPVLILKSDPSTTGPDAFSDALRLYEVNPEPDSLEFILETGVPVSNWGMSLAPRTTQSLTIGANRNWTSGEPSRENLYRIQVSLGQGAGYQYYWLPVEATRSDLQGGALNSPNPSSSGLWVGEVLLNHVTSIGEPGTPLQKSSSVLPMQILIHVDAAGNASLLSHVLFMQTKTADESVPAEPVLVIDEAKIPFYAGILERDGKKVGRRFETAAYDLPRRFETDSQPADLLTIIAEALNYLDGNNDPDPTQVTDTDLEDYVFEQTSRPAGLAEAYHLHWPLEGGLGPNSIVRTAPTQELRLDPFHRSNPFRHAFHPSHGAGLPISRSFSINLDDTNEDGLLLGTYSEAFTGLTALGTPLTASGPVTLRRVSDISELQ